MGVCLGKSEDGESHGVWGHNWSPDQSQSLCVCVCVCVCVCACVCVCVCV